MKKKSPRPRPTRGKKSADKKRAALLRATAATLADARRRALDPKALPPRGATRRLVLDRLARIDGRKLAGADLVVLVTELVDLLAPEGHSGAWRKAEDEILRQIFARCRGAGAAAEAQRALAKARFRPRTAGAISQRAAALGCKRPEPNRWSAEQDEVIRKSYERADSLTATINALVAAGFPRRSAAVVSLRATTLGIHRSGTRWTAAEDAIVRAGYVANKKIMEIAQDLEKQGFRRITRGAIMQRAISLGITVDKVKYWRPEETAIALAALRAGKPNREVIAELKAAGYERGVTSILKFRQKHNLRKYARLWHAHEFDTLRKGYADGIGPKAIGAALNRDSSEVSRKAWQLRITRSRDWPHSDIRLLQDAHAEELRLVDVAEELGRPYANVAGMAKRLGLSFRTNLPPPGTDALEEFFAARRRHADAEAAAATPSPISIAAARPARPQ